MHADLTRILVNVRDEDILHRGDEIGLLLAFDLVELVGGVGEHVHHRADIRVGEVVVDVHADKLGIELSESSTAADVTKILDVSADGKIISLDNQNGAARVFGRVNFKVLYLNGDGETRGLDYFADFTEVIQNDSLSGRLYAQIAVIDVDTSISGGIRLNAVVKITLYRVAENDKKCLVGADDDVYVENTAMKCQRFITSMNAPFTVTDEYDTKTDVAKILLTRAGTYVDAATAGMGNVLLSGASDVTVTYLANDKVYVKDFHIPYSEEFAADGVEIGQKLSAEVVVKNARVVIAGHREP